MYMPESHRGVSCLKLVVQDVESCLMWVLKLVSVRTVCALSH